MEKDIQYNSDRGLPSNYDRVNRDWDNSDMIEEEVPESDPVSENGPTVIRNSEEQETISDIVSDIQEEDIPDMGFPELDSDDEEERAMHEGEETTADPREEKSDEENSGQATETRRSSRIRTQPDRLIYQSLGGANHAAMAVATKPDVASVVNLDPEWVPRTVKQARNCSESEPYMEALQS